LPTIQINKTAFYPTPQKTLGILQKISPVFAKTQDNVILVAANDISHFDQLLKSLHFYNTGRQGNFAPIG
jgi:hypothetical protein